MRSSHTDSICCTSLSSLPSSFTLKLYQQLTLTLGCATGQHHIDMHKLVTLGKIRTQDWHAQASHPESVIWLSARSN